MRRRFEVEQLPPERWARIEREVFEQLDREEAQAPVTRAPESIRSRRPMVAFVLAGAAAAVIGAVAWEKLRPSHAELATVSRVTTDDAASHVQVGENTLDVGAHSAVLIHGDDGAGIELVLDHGDIECEVAPRQGRPPFVVSAGDVRVRVIGTHFHVARTGDAVDVSVQHGTVEVDENARVTLVHTGELWPPRIRAQVPTPKGTTSETTPPVTATATTAAASPLFAPSTHAAATAPHNPLTTEPSPRERYEHALGIESSQPDVALSTYRELAVGSDAWAMNALFAEARLELERGHRDDARRLANEYLARFPSGPNARDARELRARLE